MDKNYTRRDVLRGMGVLAGTLAAGPMFAATTKPRKIQIGHTGITWMNSQVDQAIQAISSLGFYGFETFGDVLTKWQEQGGLQAVLEKNQIPLISAYCTVNLTEPSRRADEMTKATNWCKLIKECNGRIFVVGPNQVKRETFDFAANKANIVSTLNELALLVEQQGLTPVLHQHTGTCIE